MANPCDYNFVSICAKNLDLKDPIYEFGSYQISHQVAFANYRPFFPNKKYFGIDQAEGIGVDEIRDIYKPGFEPESIDTIICSNTLEHLEYPREAIQEMFRVLKPGGS